VTSLLRTPTDVGCRDGDGAEYELLRLGDEYEDDELRELEELLLEEELERPMLPASTEMAVIRDAATKILATNLDNFT
jgi:hypothetical protein